MSRIRSPAMTRPTFARLALALLCLLGAGAARAAGQEAAPGASRRSDVIYGHKYGMALTMEVLAPPRPNGVGVLWIVSSSGRSSREQTLTESFQRRIGPLLERGYVVFAVIHGSAPIFNVQEQATDVRRAVRFVRSHAADYGVDPARLGIAGASAGGMLALLAAMDPRRGDTTAMDPVERVSSRVQAAGAFFPPTDLVSYGAPGRSVVDLMQQRDGVVDPTFQLFAVDPRLGARTPITARDDVLRILGELSPVTHVTADAPPTILIHGDADQAVPVQQSRLLIERLTAAGVPARLVVHPGAGHAYPGWEADAALIADWFDQQLRRMHRAALSP